MTTSFDGISEFPVTWTNLNFTDTSCSFPLFQLHLHTGMQACAPESTSRISVHFIFKIYAYPGASYHQYATTPFHLNDADCSHWTPCFHSYLFSASYY